MCPLSDDALLDWALAPGEADPEIERHLRECPSCRERSAAVLREQDLLRSALVEPQPSLRLERSLRPQTPVWPRVGIAALLLMAITVGVPLRARRTMAPPASLSARRARADPVRSRHRGPEDAAARETPPEREDQRSLGLSRAALPGGGLVLEGWKLPQRPLAAFRRAGAGASPLGARVLHGPLAPREPRSASHGLREQVRMFLNPEQVLAFEFSRKGWSGSAGPTSRSSWRTSPRSSICGSRRRRRCAPRSIELPRAELPLPRRPLPARPARRQPVAERRGAQLARRPIPRQVRHLSPRQV